MPVRAVMVIKAEPSIEEKVNAKHSITLDEIKEAAVYCEVDRSSLTQSDGQDDRLSLTGTTGRGRKLNIVLFADRAEPTSWWLGTAMPKTSNRRF